MRITRWTAAMVWSDRVAKNGNGESQILRIYDVPGAAKSETCFVYVNRGSDVRNTVVAGKILMKNGQVTTLRAAEVLRDARAMAERVRSAVR